MSELTMCARLCTQVAAAILRHVPAGVHIHHTAGLRWLQLLSHLDAPWLNLILLCLPTGPMRRRASPR